MSCCGGNCGCGSSGGCGNACGGRKMYPDLAGERGATAAAVVDLGAAGTLKGFQSYVCCCKQVEAAAGSEGGGCDCTKCNCGTSCGCACCSCS